MGNKVGRLYVKYMPRTVIKGRVLVDFVVEFAKGVLEEEKAIMSGLISSATIAPSWKVYTNGASNRKGTGVGIVLEIGRAHV